MGKVALTFMCVIKLFNISTTINVFQILSGTVDKILQLKSKGLSEKSITTITTSK